MTYPAMQASEQSIDSMATMSKSQSVSRARRISGNVLIGLVSLTLVGAAFGKLVHAPFLVNQLRPFGFDDTWISILGVIELASALLFAVPRTRALGLLLITGFLGGAIATHIQHGQSPAQPAVLLAIGWTGVWLRHLEANWSKRGSPAAATARLEVSINNSQSASEASHMKRQAVVLWFSRIILAFVTVILLLIAKKYLFDPTGASAERGIVLSNGVGRTIARVGFGGFPLACAIVVAACLTAAERVRSGLWFVIALFGTVLFVRLISAVADKSLADNVPLIIPEVVFLTLTTAALILGRHAQDGGARHARI
jgi:hypothetical protein